jgi:glycosyltransferase involved in cell wall biosynthesis
MKPLRLGIFAPTFLPKCSGAEVFHHNLAVRLAEKGHKVTVVAPRGQVQALQEQDWELPYSLESYPANRWSWLKRHQGFAFWANRRALSSLQKKHRFDVWHAFVLYPTGVVLADWQSRSRVPGLVRAVGDDVSGLPSRGHMAHVQKALRNKLPLAGALVALSAEMAQGLAAIGVASDKIRIIPNAVDADRFAPDPGVRSSVRAGLGITEEDFVFLCVARNHPQKDLPTLLQAFRLLCSSAAGRKFHLVIAGRGSADLSSQVQDLAGNIHLLEIGAERSSRRRPPAMPPQKLVDLYRAADAFVLSSLLEGFSSALVEAMAAGLPIVATDAPGIRGVATHGRDSLLVPIRDPLGLAAAMRKVADESSLRVKLSSAAREASSRYSWPVLTVAYEKLYRELANRHKAPGA